MKRAVTALTLLLTLTTTLTAGAGGIEFLQVLGQDSWPFPGKASLVETTGSISSVGGLGYGVDNDGLVTGGFGLGVQSNDTLRAGYGGLIQGWEHRWGPLVVLATTRVGFGGAEWLNRGAHQGGFSLLGTAGLQMGVTVFPWFLIGIEAGAAGTMTVIPGCPFHYAAAPTLGFRLLWGSF